MSNTPPTTLTTLPTQSHITLLFKHHKSTTFLSVLPTQSFPEIKSLLLAALKARDINHGMTLPNDAQYFEFGVLVDKKDPGKGWVSIRGEERNGEYTGKEKKSSKSTTGKGKGAVGAVGDTPQSAGLHDGSFVAYRMRSPHRSKDSEKGGDDEDEDEEGDVVIDNDDPGWDVVLPSFDDEVMEEVLDVVDEKDPDP